MHTGPMGKLYSLEAHGKFGYSGAFGRLAFGYNRFGFYHWLCGIYTKKYLWGKPYYSRQKFYRPTNTYHEKRQAWRGVMRAAVLAWQSLTLEQKSVYNFRAKHYPMSGYNLFIKDWLDLYKVEVLG